MDLFQTCDLTWWSGLPCFIFYFYCLCVPHNHQPFAFGIFCLVCCVHLQVVWLSLTTTSSLNLSINLNNNSNVSFICLMHCSWSSKNSYQQKQVLYNLLEVSELALVCQTSFHSGPIFSTILKLISRPRRSENASNTQREM